MTRLDAVSYISHGVAKSPGRGDRRPLRGADSDVEQRAERSERTERDRNAGKDKEALSAYCVNLHEKAKAGKIDALIGREAELERTLQILGRRTKNNPLDVGNHGVGKTPTADGPKRTNDVTGK